MNSIKSITMTDDDLAFGTEFIRKLKANIKKRPDKRRHKNKTIKEQTALTREQKDNLILRAISQGAEII